jgi:hypothetical protein
VKLIRWNCIRIGIEISAEDNRTGVFAICKTENALCKVETTPAYTRLPWLVDENENIDLSMCAIPKEASKERIKAEFTSLMVDKYEEYYQFYMDGSLKDDKGWIRNCHQILKKSSIYSAEQ